MSPNNLKNDNRLPIVFEYISPTEYLNDFFNYHKSKTSGFTYEAWATELGFKSRSFIKMILTEERKITPHFIEVFCQSNRFLNAEQTYFSLIVSHHQSTDPDEKNYYLERILEIKSQHQDVQVLSNYDVFLSSPNLPLLLNLLSFKDVFKSAENIAEFLNQELSVVQLNLQQLETLGAAFFDSSTGQWHSKHDSFKVPTKAHNESLKTYHNNSLQEAIFAQSLPADVRRFRSLFIPLSADDYQKLLEDVDNFANRIKHKYDSSHLGGKSIYKFNLNFFPRTAVYNNHQKPVL